MPTLLFRFAVVVSPLTLLVVAACSSSSAHGVGTDAGSDAQPQSSGGATSSGGAASSGGAGGASGKGSGGSSVIDAGSDGSTENDAAPDAGRSNPDGGTPDSGKTATSIAAEYDIVEVNAGVGQTQNEAINDNGLVVGRYYTGAASVLFTWTASGGLVRVTPASGYSLPTAVNSAGIYTAYEGDAVATRTAYSNLGGAYAELPAVPSYAYWSADGINDSNVIVGGLVGTPGHGFSLSSGKYTLLGLLPSGTTSYASSINGAGVIVGGATNSSSKYVAVRFDGTTPTSLGTLGGASSFANHINDAGSIVGYADDAAGDAHAFYYAGGKMTDLGVFGGTYSSASSLNEGNVVVGSSSTESGQTAFAWTKTDGMVDLSTRLGGATDWLLESAIDINERGQIVGYAERTGADASAGFVGFVMTPKP